MPGWDTLRLTVQEEFTQSKQEGRPAEVVDALRPAFEKGRR